jgi:heat shock protein HspQ
MSMKRKDTEATPTKPGGRVRASDQKAGAKPSRKTAGKAAVPAKAAARAKAASKTTAASKVAKAARDAKPRIVVKKKPVKTAKSKTRIRGLRNARNRQPVSLARFAVGDVVRHRYYPFRGVIFDIDPVFANTEEWWQAIPQNMRPRKNQPFYHLLAENAETEYIAYVSEQNLLPDTSGAPLRHPQVAEYFIEDEDGRYRPVFFSMLN